MDDEVSKTPALSPHTLILPPVLAPTCAPRQRAGRDMTLREDVHNACEQAGALGYGRHRPWVASAGYGLEYTAASLPPLASWLYPPGERRLGDVRPSRSPSVLQGTTRARASTCSTSPTARETVPSATRPDFELRLRVVRTTTGSDGEGGTWEHDGSKSFVSVVRECHPCPILHSTVTSASDAPCSCRDASGRSVGRSVDRSVDRSVCQRLGSGRALGSDVHRHCVCVLRESGQGPCRLQHGRLGNGNRNRNRTRCTTTGPRRNSRMTEVFL